MIVSRLILKEFIVEELIGWIPYSNQHNLQWEGKQVQNTLLEVEGGRGGGCGK